MLTKLGLENLNEKTRFRKPDLENLVKKIMLTKLGLENQNEKTRFSNQVKKTRFRKPGSENQI